MQKDKIFIQEVPESLLKNYSNDDLIKELKKETKINISSFLDRNIPVKIKEFTIARELTNRLKSISQNETATIFMTMIGALNILFCKYSAYDDICLGIPLTFKREPVTGNSAALFNRLTSMGNKLSPENSFMELLEEIRTTLVEVSEHKSSSYQSGEEMVIRKKDSKCSMAAQVTLVVENSAENSQFQYGILQLSGEPLTPEILKPAINFFLKEKNEEIKGLVEYDAQLYKEDRIVKIIDHLQELLVSIAASPNEKISKLNILTTNEKQKLLIEFNETKTAYPRDKSIVKLFEEQVIKNPNKVAAVFEKEKLTYRELNKRSNQVAHYLQSRGVKKETLIPICVERSLEMLVGILGILKAGAAYVPIDPEYPEDRINYMLEDTSATLVITSKISSLKLPVSSGIDIIEIDGHSNAISNMSIQNPATEINSRNLAYVIYTSGSTGKPKGVMIEHQAVADHCFGLIKVAKLDTCESFALFSPLVFDAGHSIIFTSLFLGTSLNILSQKLIVDGEKLVSYLEKNPVDCIKIVPSVWLSYTNGDNIILANKVMIFGGETFSGKIQQHLIKLNYKGVVYNHYGPTEATIGKCIHKVDLKRTYKTVPIGKPFSNTQLYVVDQWNQIVPLGVAGELYIAGEGIAREYLKRPDLSAEKFITNPFITNDQFTIYDPADSRQISRLYKTGDKVRWNDDGEIEYLGRIDEQVKINGHRIELGEIENVLLQNKKIKQAAVRLNEDSHGNKILVGYAVTQGVFDKQETIKLLKEKLPDYMIPSLWMVLDHLPLTSNGKIDKKALPVPDVSQLMKNQYAAPSNETEAALVKIWENLLGIEKVGVYDTFFELGGNSIQAVSMFTRIRKHFGRTLSLATIFQAPDISKLAAIIQQNDDVINLSCLVPIQPQGSNLPFFCIHAGAGNVLFYKDLAKNLGMEQPLYGLMARGLNGKEPFHTSVEDMATHYIKEIRSIQPHGRYFLAGYCFGGIIAFEMAQQLFKRGDKVELLVLFNSRSPSYRNSSSLGVNHNGIQKKPPSLVYVISASAGKFSLLHPKEKILFPLRIVKNGLKITGRFLYFKTRNKLLRLEARILRVGFNYYLAKGLLLPRLLRTKYLLHTNGDMAKAYKAGVYPGSVLVFRSPQIFKDPYLGWKEHVSGGIDSYDVPGRYRSRSKIMKEPFVKVLSEKLKSILGKPKVKSSASLRSEAKIVS